MCVCVCVHSSVSRFDALLTRLTLCTQTHLHSFVKTLIQQGRLRNVWIKEGDWVTCFASMIYSFVTLFPKMHIFDLDIFSYHVWAFLLCSQYRCFSPFFFFHVLAADCSPLSVCFLSLRSKISLIFSPHYLFFLTLSCFPLLFSCFSVFL